jgi:hypothetical protein
VYNNILYNTNARSSLTFTNSGGSSNEIWEYKNNVFYNAYSGASVAFTTGTPFNYSANLYYGCTPPAKDTAPVTGDPLFTGVPAFSTGTSTDSRFKDFSLLRPGAGSPLINQGVAYTAPVNKIDISPDGKDYGGTALSGAADIGLYASNFNGLRGIVVNDMGENISGAEITLTPQTGTDLTATSGTDGGYFFASVPNGSYTLLVTAANHEGSQTSFTVNSDTPSWQVLSPGALGNVAPRIITGMVMEGASALSGVTVVISKNSSDVATATSGADGSFTLTGVPYGNGYTITASKTGYVSQTIENFQVPAFAVIESVNFVLVSSTHVYYNEPFDTLNDWNVTTGGHTVEIISDPDDPANSLLHIYKASGSAATGIYNKTNAGAYGVFTIETRMKRGTVPADYGQFHLYTYDAAKSFTSGDGTNSAANIAMERDIRTHFTTGSSATTTVQTYTANTWYQITLRVDTLTKTFTFYVDGEVKGSGNLRTAVDKIDIFNICAGQTGTFGDFWVDYIYVYQGEPAGDSRSELIAGSPVSSIAADTSATVSFTGALGLTLGAGDFTVTNGGTITGVNVSGDTVSVTVGFTGNFGTAGSKTYTVGISPGSLKIKGSAAVTITQAGDPRKILTAGPPVSVPAADTSATVSFTGASGAALETGDFAVTSGGTITGVNVSDDTASVTVSFAANTDTANDKTYTVSIASSSVNLIGTATVTITQFKQMAANTVTGTVTAKGSPLEGATVSITGGTTVTSDGSGEYALENVPLGSNYTITVTKTGYKTRTITGITVEAGPAINANFDLLNELTGTVIYDMDFDSLANGAFSDAGWQFQGNNSSAIEADPDNTGGKVLRLMRNGIFDFVNMAAANASDNNPFTREIRVKRTATTGQWALYTNNVAALAGNSGSVANILMVGGNIGTHANGGNSSTVTNVQTMAANTWYKIGIVVYPSSSAVDTFDFYVDDIKKLEAKPVRNDNPVNYFHFYSNDGGGDLILDYFRVYANQPQF